MVWRGGDLGDASECEQKWKVRLTKMLDVSNDVDLDRKIWQTFSRSAVNGVMANFLMTSIRSQAMKNVEKKQSTWRESKDGTGSCFCLVVES